jgi:hypothetical protein
VRIETLKTFRDLTETGSFSKVAALNFVAKSAVRRQAVAVIHRKGKVFSAAAREFTCMLISA